MKTDTAPAHSLLGASGAYRWLNCPGSFRLSQTMPERPASVHAATGTLAHDLIEVALRTALKHGVPPGLLQIEEDYALGKTVLREGHEILIDQDFLDGISTMLDYTMIASTTADWCNVEFRVDLGSYFLPDRPPPVPMFGRVDVALVDLGAVGGMLELIDYKNGAGVVVTPAENPQLLYYAAGVFAQLPDNQRRQVQRIRLTIVQPHAPGLHPIRSWETSTLDLLMWIDEVLLPGVAACGEPDAALNPGSWCRFCPALHACPRLKEDAIAMAKHEFDDVSMPADPDDLAAALDIAERAITWATALQAHALEQLQRQVRVPGWEMVPTRPTRRWIDDEHTTAAVLRTIGVKDEVIWETKLKSPAQMEKALTKTTAGRQAWADQIADVLVEAKSSGMKLARTARADARGEFANADES